MTDIIRIGTIYASEMKENYSNNYTHIIISYDVKTQETIAQLYSNWNSSYNQTIKTKHVDPLDIADRYR